MQPNYQPSVLIGTLTSVLALLGQIVAAASANGTPTTATYVTAAIVALLPGIAGWLISHKVVSKAWLTTVISDAESAIEAVRPIADQAGVPARQVPST